MTNYLMAVGVAVFVVALTFIWRGSVRWRTQYQQGQTLRLATMTSLELIERSGLDGGGDLNVYAQEYLRRNSSGK